MLLLPYQGKKEGYVIKSMKKIMNTLLPTGIATKNACVENKFSTSFRAKDVINLNIIMTIYQGRCPKIGYNDHYLGETGPSMSSRVLDNAGSCLILDSHLLKYSLENGQIGLYMNNCYNYMNKLLRKDAKSMLKKEKLLKRF